MSTNSVGKLDLKNLQTAELYQLFAALTDEMRVRGLSRGMNNPIADLAEKLVADYLGARIMPASNAGYDLIGPDGLRYEVKSRRQNRHRNRPVRQVSAVHLETKTFDFLAAVIFNEDCTVNRAALIPWEVVRDNASYDEDKKRWRFNLTEKIWAHSSTRILSL